MVPKCCPEFDKIKWVAGDGDPSRHTFCAVTYLYNKDYGFDKKTWQSQWSSNTRLRCFVLLVASVNDSFRYRKTRKEWLCPRLDLIYKAIKLLRKDKRLKKSVIWPHIIPEEDRKDYLDKLIGYEEK